MSPSPGNATHDLFREEPFRLREIFIDEYRKAADEAARSGPSWGEERIADPVDPGDQFDVGEFVVTQLPEPARRDIARFASHLKYWLDRAWIRAAIRKSEGLDPQWPHDPLNFFKPGGGANELVEN